MFFLTHSVVFWCFCAVFITQVELAFPDEGLVYDYRLDDAGITEADVDDEEGGDVQARKVEHHLLHSLGIDQFVNYMLRES